MGFYNTWDMVLSELHTLPDKELLLFLVLSSCNISYQWPRTLHATSEVGGMGPLATHLRGSGEPPVDMFLKKGKIICRMPFAET